MYLRGTRGPSASGFLSWPLLLELLRAELVRDLPAGLLANWLQMWIHAAAVCTCSVGSINDCGPSSIRAKILRNARNVQGQVRKPKTGQPLAFSPPSLLQVVITDGVEVPRVTLYSYSLIMETCKRSDSPAIVYAGHEKFGTCQQLGGTGRVGGTNRMASGPPQSSHALHAQERAHRARACMYCSICIHTDHTTCACRSWRRRRELQALLDRGTVAAIADGCASKAKPVHLHSPNGERGEMRNS